MDSNKINVAVGIFCLTIIYITNAYYGIDGFTRLSILSAISTLAGYGIGTAHTIRRIRKGACLPR